MLDGFPPGPRQDLDVGGQLQRLGGVPAKRSKRQGRSAEDLFRIGQVADRLAERMALEPLDLVATVGVKLAASADARSPLLRWKMLLCTPDFPTDLDECDDTMYDSMLLCQMIKRKFKKNHKRSKRLEKFCGQ